MIYWLAVNDCQLFCVPVLRSSHELLEETDQSIQDNYMITYNKPNKKEDLMYDIDTVSYSIVKYQQRSDRVIKSLLIDGKILTNTDKVTFKCIRCGKQVELIYKKFIKRDEEKYCRGCAISVNHERNPGWLIVSDEQKKAISERNSGLKVKEYETRICPGCGKEFEVRLTAHNMTKRFCSRECNIKNWAEYGRLNGGGYAHLGIRALLGRDTKPEIRMKKILEENNIRFIHQKTARIHNGKLRVFDFWLPDHNTFIEVDGDYWHYNKNNPRIAKKFPTSKQLSKMVHDYEKNHYCHLNNINLIRIWESELEDRAEELVEGLTR